MGTRYDNVPVGANLQDQVRVFFADEAGAPVSGLTVSYKVRNAAGAQVSSGTLSGIAGAAGWYRPGSYVLAAGLHTVEYAPPAGFLADSDAVLVEVNGTDALKLDTEFLRSVMAGNWKVTGNQMIFYKEGLPAVELHRFNLYDGAGVPSQDSVFERRKV